MPSAPSRTSSSAAERNASSSPSAFSHTTRRGEAPGTTLYRTGNGHVSALPISPGMRGNRVSSIRMPTAAPYSVLPPQAIRVLSVISLVPHWRACTSLAHNPVEDPPTEETHVGTSEAGRDRSCSYPARPPHSRLSRAFRRPGRWTRKAHAWRRIRTDQFRGEPDATTAGRYVGATPHPYARRRIYLHRRGRTRARDQCGRDTAASGHVRRLQSGRRRCPPSDQP